MAFELSQLNDLDFENVGSWPLLVKVAAYVTTFIVVLGLFYYFDTNDQQLLITQIEKKEVALKKDFEAKYRRASNLEEYRQQLLEMEQMFKNLLQQLPSNASIPELIEDISNSESQSGLEIQAGQLQNEIKRDIYTEKPFSLVVRGKYHELGRFVSRVASLPRIVTLHDFTIAVDKSATEIGLGEDPVLEMTIAAKTYRSIQEEEK